MELWFSEMHTADAKLSLRVDRQLYGGKSDYQKIDVFETPAYGKILVLDDCIMFTERDEFIYHDMIVHTPMAVHPHVRNVLVIGGGDGGAVRELVRYPDIEHIDLVDIDEDVTRVCREFMPFMTTGLTDPRVELHFEDGLRYIRSCRDRYDLVIVDSTDPFGPGEGLFSREFYGNCHRALKSDGILVNQHESPFYPEDAENCRRMHRNILTAFPVCRVYQAHIPTYPSGHWLFGFASKKYHPLHDLDEERWSAYHLRCRYYTSKLHRGAFYLPAYVEELLSDVETKR